MRTRSGPVQIQISGMLMPWLNDGPLVVMIERKQFVVIYSSIETLDESMAEFGISEYSVKKIDDGKDFIRSMEEQHVPVILDPRKHGGMTRYTLIVSGDQSPPSDLTSNLSN